MENQNKPKFELGEEFYYLDEKTKEAKRYFIRKVQEEFVGKKKVIEYGIDIVEQKNKSHSDCYDFITEEKLLKRVARYNSEHIADFMEVLRKTFDDAFPTILDLKTKIGIIEEIYYAEQRQKMNSPLKIKKGRK